MENQEFQTKEIENNEEKISLSSKKKWFWLAVVVSLISPVSGVILAVAFLTEKELKKEGRIILILAVVWGIVSIYLVSWLGGQGYLPVY